MGAKLLDCSVALGMAQTKELECDETVCFIFHRIVSSYRETMELRNRQQTKNCNSQDSGSSHEAEC